jgi:hypothetical protein
MHRAAEDTVSVVQAYLSICAIYQDEAPYLREWIEFHRLVGVERFFLYDHNSTDDRGEVLAPYIADGTVVNYDWPVDPGQKEAYDHCLAEHGEDSRWIAFIDIDEFLFSPTGVAVPEILRRFEHLPGVGVPWGVFGTSGHKTRPSGLVIESYTSRTASPRRQGWFKSVIDPSRTFRAFGPHAFVYKDKPAFPGQVPQFAMFDLLRINHYWTKSEAELREKFARLRADTGGPALVPVERALKMTSAEKSVRDEAILRYLPELREALAARATRSGS